MSFRPIEQRIAGNTRKSASIRLMLRGAESSAPACIVSFRMILGLQLKWKKGESVAVQLGEGDDAGKMRLVRDGAPAIAAVRLNQKGGMTFDLGHLPSLNDGEPSDKIAVDARIIDKNTVEIVLPDWSAAPATRDDDEREEAPPARIAPPQSRSKSNGHGPREPSATTINGVHIDFTADNETIAFKGKEMEVTKRQAQMIAMMARGMPNPIGREHLRTKLFGQNDKESSEAALDMIASDLTKALGAVGLALNTVKGIGFGLREAGK